MEKNRYGIENINIRYNLSSEIDFKNIIVRYQYYSEDRNYRVINYTVFGIRIWKKTYGKE